MTFKDIAIKNFRANFRKYLSYFLCNSFAIMIFFIYTTLVFNQNLLNSLSSSPIKMYLIMMIVIVGLFAIFFVTYAHSSFNKSRSKEFGLYLTLGMTNKDIGRLIKIENSIIILLSLAAGLISGTIFSRLFFLIIVNLLNLEGVGFAHSYKSYLLTSLVFIFIFTLVILLGRRMAKKLELAKMLKGNKSNIKFKKYNPFVGISGIVLIVTSLVCFDMFLKKELLPGHTYLPLILIGVTILGLYLTIAHLGSTLIFFSKRFKDQYFNNIININEVQNKFSQYKKILFIMTLLTIIVIYFIGMTYSSYSITAKHARNEHPYHMMYVVRQNDNDIVEKKLYEIAANNNVNVREQKKLGYIEGRIYKETNGKKGWFGSVEVISAKGFNRLSSQKLSLKRGEAVTLLKLTEPERNQWFNDQVVRLQMGEKTYDFNFKKEMTNMLVNDSKRTSRFMVIINTDDYQKIKDAVRPNKIGVFNLINFRDWKEATTVSKQLFQFMEDRLKNYQPNNSKLVRYEVATRIEFFRALKEQYGIYLFLMSFVGLLFFISSGSVLYLKLFTDIERMKIKYKKLFRIGISGKEIKRIISKELSFVFFAPLILGSGLGLFFVMVSTTNFALQGELMLNTLIVVGVYTFLQYIFYLIARQKYLKEIRDL